MKKFNVLFFLLFIISSALEAQEILTLDQAVELALKNNYEVAIKRNNSTIAANNASTGNAAMLPQLSIDASANSSNENIHQLYSSGLEVNSNGVNSNDISSGVNLTWTLFDGMKMFIVYNKLNELKNISELELRIEMENIISEVIQTYFGVVKDMQTLKFIQQNIGTHEERVKIAETRLSIGSAPRTDLLQAKVDLNRERSLLLSQQINIKAAKAELNKLLSKETSHNFSVADSINILSNLVLKKIQDKLEEKNSNLILAQKNIRVGALSLKEINSQRYPRLTFTSNYSLSQSENEAGFSLLNRNEGLNIGFTLNWTLFNGFNINRQYQNAKLDLENINLIYKDVLSETEKELFIAWEKYQVLLQVLELEKESFIMATENVSIMLERYRLGESTTLELREAQQSLEDAQLRLVNTRYDLKLSETLLLKLSGNLVSN